MTPDETKQAYALVERLTGFTPGPWRFYADLPSKEPNWHIVTTANKMRVLANTHIEPHNPMDAANAALIAAAPDLHAALTAALARAEKAEAERDAAWNDAIEAAAECVGHITQSKDRDAILTLKKGQPT